MARASRHLTVVLASLLVTPLAAAGQGIIEGTVTDGSGQPIEGVEVSVAGEMGTLTGAAGTYRLADLPAGPHSVGFTRLGYGASSHEVNVADNETTRLDVVLLPAPISVERLVVVGSRAHSRTGPPNRWCRSTSSRSRTWRGREIPT